NNNGKVDRQALPLPHSLGLESEVAYVVPKTELEQNIAAIWQQVLNLEKVGIHDNFFELGGHSLLMVQVHTQLRQVSQTELTILDMFRYPTINSLAEYLNSSSNPPSFVEETNIQTEKLKEGKARLKKRLQQIKSNNY
ncbi:phosphopantetheine-binding protein, partial [Nostoc sp. UHCC 0252]|uniref:phosphopantetheine-binding protein n=1 Tax=Nostoc sp. UHCC 0252 TaxID=3110241 RepID=UPI002B208CD1